jgi:hypothetical protein
MNSRKRKVRLERKVKLTMVGIECHAESATNTRISRMKEASIHVLK